MVTVWPSTRLQLNGAAPIWIGGNPITAPPRPAPACDIRHSGDTLSPTPRYVTITNRMCADEVVGHQ
jgi:hypothetical protein